METPLRKIRVRAPFSSLEEHEVFAVESTRAQVCIRTGSSRAVLRIAGQVIEVEPTHGVAVFWVEGLHPNTTYVAYVEDRLGTDLGRISLRTRPLITGATTKFATISDIHLGLHDFANQRSMSEDEDTDLPFALRCAAAAIREAIEWGAEVLVIKGDLVDTGATEEWELAHQLLDDLPIPVIATWGNHDVWSTREVEPTAMASSFGLDPGPIVTVDLDNVRIIVADTSIPGRGQGDLEQHRDVIVQKAKGDTPVFLGIHHNIMRSPLPWFIPVGIPMANAAPTVEALEATNPNVFISSGHTHRNRKHALGKRGRLTFTEVAATADYPGVWAGYEVSGEMIRQTVRRTAAPEALEWSEHVRGALAGIWPRWAQGQLGDRCVDMLLS